MKFRPYALAATLVAAGACTLLTATAAFAQAKEQFFPALVYRTGAYAPNGVPFANGYVDYFKLVNAKGGINGVKIIYEECETGYATDRGVECYERLKGKNGGATVFQPLSTGITFALTDKAPGDKIPLITAGYGRSESTDGNVFKWNFPLTGTYWDAADILVQHIGKKEGGLDKLKGKKIALVYHDSPYGKEPIPLLEERAKQHGFELQLLPVTAPGRRAEGHLAADPPEPPGLCVPVGLGRDELHRAEGSGGHRLPARQDVRRVVGRAPSPTSRTSATAPRATTAWRCSTAPSRTRQVVKDVLANVHAKGQGTGPKDEVGQVLYMRGLIGGDAGRRRRQARAGALRQGQGHDRRAGALGLREPGAGPEEARRAGLCRRDAADQHLLRRPPRRGRWRACTPGTAASGTSAPTGSRPTSRSSSR